MTASEPLSQKTEGTTLIYRSITDEDVYLKYRDYFAGVCASYLEYPTQELGFQSWAHLVEEYDRETLQLQLSQNQSQVDRQQHNEDDADTEEDHDEIERLRMPFTETLRVVAKTKAIPISEILFNIRFLAACPSFSPLKPTFIHELFSSKYWLALANKLVDYQSELDFCSRYQDDENRVERRMRTALGRFQELHFVYISTETMYWSGREKRLVVGDGKMGSFMTREEEMEESAVEKAKKDAIEKAGREAQGEREELIIAMIQNAERLVAEETSGCKGDLKTGSESEL